MISPLTDAPTRGRAMYMDGRDAPCIPAIPATMDGYDAPVSSGKFHDISNVNLTHANAVSSAPPQPRVRIHRSEYLPLSESTPIKSYFQCIQ